ncbi:putative membrane protein [Rhodococcus sp. AG1013]|uniref:MauE/DoxX family redox-associated membrane protein n=1 Tax=Rhodococcus sp. AG1013 TaxID=2183996 RepID=UPI000E0B8B6D|nr:MauE/DoxX family redox-associated membrane protein [Rhodococcus sp. AG1013]RDI25826.1 putative membrane protein [Rhodococcus sp. AG1013]
MPSNRDRSGQAPAIRLAALLFGSGILHFAKPQPFDAIVPAALPGRARTYTYVSGVAELATAAALAVPRTRRLGGALAAALFVAVFPANVQMAVSWLRSDRVSAPAKAAAVARLALQIPLVTQALKARRNAR